MVDEKKNKLGEKKKEDGENKMARRTRSSSSVR
jgi:hypothetical protein